MFRKDGIQPSIHRDITSRRPEPPNPFRRSQSSDGTRRSAPIAIKFNKSSNNTPLNSPKPGHHQWSSQGNPHKRSCERCQRHPELDCVVLIDGERCGSCRKANKYCTLEWETKKDHERADASRGRNQDHRGKGTLKGIPAIAVHTAQPESDKVDWNVLVREAEKLDSEIARFAWDLTRKMERGRTRAQVADMNQKINEFRDASQHFCHWSRRASEYMSQ